MRERRPVGDEITLGGLKLFVEQRPGRVKEGYGGGFGQHEGQRRLFPARKGWCFLADDG
jgi:hypothetical protein